MQNQNLLFVRFWGTLTNKNINGVDKNAKDKLKRFKL